MARRDTRESVVRSNIHWLRGQARRLVAFVDGDGEAKCPECGHDPTGATGRERGILLTEQRHIQRLLVTARQELVDLIAEQTPPEAALTPAEAQAKIEAEARTAPLDQIEAVAMVWAERRGYRIVVDDGGELRLERGRPRLSVVAE